MDGHGAIAYRAVAASGRELFGWTDPVRKFPLRIRTEDGAVITTRNVRDEAQAPHWFEIPPNLRKFDPQALIHQIKQSDVWVAYENDSPRPYPWIPTFSSTTPRRGQHLSARRRAVLPQELNRIDWG
jgi:hypothetical protein